MKINYLNDTVTAFAFEIPRNRPIEVYRIKGQVFINANDLAIYIGYNDFSDIKGFLFQSDIITVNLRTAVNLRGALDMIRYSPHLGQPEKDTVTNLILSQIVPMASTLIA